MPKSKGRRSSHGRPNPQARVTQAEQARAEGSKKVTMAQYRRRRFAGWTLVSIAIFIGVSHWVGHLGFFHVASPGMEDLLIGYPTAALLGIAGSIVLSKS